MALISDHEHVLRYGFDGGVLRGIGRARLDRAATIRAWFAEKWREWSYRRSVYATERALSQLNNRALRDLGIDRSMISATARAAANREFGLPSHDDLAR